MLYNLNIFPFHCPRTVIFKIPRKIHFSSWSFLLWAKLPNLFSFSLEMQLLNVLFHFIIFPVGKFSIYPKVKHVTLHTLFMALFSLNRLSSHLRFHTLVLLYVPHCVHPFEHNSYRIILQFEQLHITIHFHDALSHLYLNYIPQKSIFP